MDAVLITGVGGPAGKAATTFFLEQGFKVIGTDIHPVDFNGDEFVIVPQGDSPGYPEAIIACIRDKSPLLFVPTVTEELPVCAGLKKQIRALGCEIFISNTEISAVINDKYLTSRKLAADHVATPHTLLSSQVGKAQRAGDLLGYPFVVKPRHGRGGRGVTLIQNLIQASMLKPNGGVYQEFVSGIEFDANLFVYPAGVVQSVVVLWKSRMKQGIVGNAVTVERIKREDVAELAIDTAVKLNLEGPLDMDIRLDCHCRPKVLEINGRIGANSLAAREILEAMSRTLQDRHAKALQ